LELWEIYSVLRRHLDNLADEPTTRPIFPGGNDAFTWDSFVWAYSLVESRSFKVNITQNHGTSLLPKKDDINGMGPLQILVPFADLFNHHNAFPALQ